MFFGGKLLRPASLSKFSAFPNFRVFRSAPAVPPPFPNFRISEFPRFPLRPCLTPEMLAYEIQVIRAFVAAQRVA
jgi:hypothetical protein